MKSEKKTPWEIYYDKNLDNRVILKRFMASSKAEAEKYFSDFKKTSNDELSHTWKLDDRRVDWWRIYKAEKDGKRTTVHVFKAPSRKSAHAKFLRYKKPDDGKYFYSTAFVVGISNKNGVCTMSHFSPRFILGEDYESINKKYKEYNKGYEDGKKETEKRYAKELLHFAKTGHSSEEWYDLGYHILNDLRYNLPILIEKCVGHPMRISNKAAETLKLETDVSGQPKTKDKTILDKHSKLAEKMWKDELKCLLYHLNLFTYYSDHGIVDETDKAMVKVDKDFRNTIPHFEDTEEIDYRSLEKLADCEYEYVTKWLSKHLLDLWD